MPMLLRVAYTIVTTSYNLHFLIIVLSYPQESTGVCGGKIFTTEANRGCLSISCVLSLQSGS